MSRLYLSNPCAFLLYFSTRCCGRSRRPAFPAPSVQERDNELASPGQIMSREYLRPFEIVWANSLSSRTSEHSERRSGTHNHRTRFYEGWSSSMLNNNILWLWVPAFAGTTAV